MSKKRGRPPRKRSDDGVSLTEFVRRELMLAIKSGRYRPGERILESAILAWLDVSRTPVREAIHRLHTDGLVVEDPDGGFRVAELDVQAVQDFYEVRAALEAEAARFAAQHISAIEIELLHQNLAQAYDSLASPQALAQFDDAFHQAIYQASHNRYLQESLTQLRTRLGLLHGTVYELNERRRVSLEEHKAILVAVEQRDGNAAFQAAKRHMTTAKEARLKMFHLQQD